MCDFQLQDHHLNDQQRRYVYGVMFPRLRKLKRKARRLLAEKEAATMRQVCSVCEEIYGTKPGPDEDTHGNCPVCHPRLVAGDHFNIIRQELGMAPLKVQV